MRASNARESGVQESAESVKQPGYTQRGPCGRSTSTVPPKPAHRANCDHSAPCGICYFYGRNTALISSERFFCAKAQVPPKPRLASPAPLPSSSCSLSFSRVFLLYDDKVCVLFLPRFQLLSMLNVHSQLTMALHGCPPTVDDSFGPWAGPNCRRGFDFTLLFEEAVLSIPISVLFLLVLPCQIRQLVKSDVKVVPSCFGLCKHVSSQN